jgi:hypothetical protein
MMDEPHGGSGETGGKAGGGAGGETGDSEPSLPAIDFSTFVLSLSTTALYQLGMVTGPGGEQIGEPSSLLAQQTIDTLKMIRRKTEGNLEPEEAKLLESLLYELHSRFHEATSKQ